MYWLAVVVFCLVSAHPLRCYETSTSDNGILEYLQMDPDHVLEHEMVEIDLPGRLHKRDFPSRIPVNFRALDIDINLLLHPSDSTFASDETPVFFASYIPGSGVHYERVYHAMKKVGHLLEDPNHLASVVLGSDRFGRATINGYLRPRTDSKPLVIRSLPQHIANEYLRNRRSTVDLRNDSVNSTYHLVARLNEHASQARFMNQFRRAEPQRNWYPRPNGFPGPNANVNNQQRPDTVYPQVLVQVDHTYQADLSTRGITPFLEYLLAFWNGVDMVYRHVDYPKFRFNIAGIVIATNPEATPFIATSMINDTLFDCVRAIERSATFLFNVRNTFPLDSYDLVATMTHFMMGENGDWNYLGWAYIGGVCDVNFNQGYTRGSALIRDSGAFSGIITAAHELGHLFGLEHENPRGPGNCLPELGFLMTSKSTATIQASTLSRCSLRRIRDRFDHGRYSCMYNKPPVTGRQLPRLLPGKIDSLARQCRALGLGWPVFPNDQTDDICVQYFCSDPEKPQGFWQTRFMGAAPGTPCGSENDVEPKMCLRNRCVGV